jgi:hypothetical protein
MRAGCAATGVLAGCAKAKRGQSNKTLATPSLNAAGLIFTTTAINRNRAGTSYGNTPFCIGFFGSWLESDFEDQEVVLRRGWSRKRPSWLRCAFLRVPIQIIVAIVIVFVLS